MIPDRKEFTNFAAKSNPDSNNPGVSTGVPLSKVRDGIKNASQLKDLNATTTLKAIDKLVSAVLPNNTASANNPLSSDTDSEGGSGSAMEPAMDLSKGKTDPYAAIAAGPDHPKLPPDLKISPGGAEGEAPPVVPVGMSDDNKAGPESDEGPHPQSPDGEKSLRNLLKLFFLSSLTAKPFLLHKKSKSNDLIAVLITISMESTFFSEEGIALTLFSKCSYLTKAIQTLY